jgi:chemotaxis protein MotB
MSHASHDEPPVIRIVRKRHAEAHHGGAWKVAYADFVTAMMALFIVLWILGQGEEVQTAVSSYFRNPTGKAVMAPVGGPSSKVNRMSIRQESGADNSMVNFKDDAVKTLEHEADELRTMIEQQPDLKALAQQISIEVTPEGLRVEISESATQPLFETGSASLSPRLVEALRALAVEYKRLPNKLVIEGHTDASPYASGSSMSNWDLSTSRANEARRILQANGVPDDQIFMVRGFADRRPRFDDPHDARNRRISTLLLSVEGMNIALGQQQSYGITPPVPKREIVHE